MRANKLINYRSILQVLGESGCSFCSFLKDVQAAALQKPDSTKFNYVCNFHTWGLAAMQKASLAAGPFLRLLEKQFQSSREPPCDICVPLSPEEGFRIREFMTCLSHQLVAECFRSQTVLCSIHGAKLKKGAIPALASTIRAIIERYREQPMDDYGRLRNDYQLDTANWGLLGHVAEFLAAQRVLHA